MTGHLDAPGTAGFGFELTFFRFALVPPASDAAPSGSAWRTRQIYVAHFAVTDLERRRFHSAERYERDALGLAGARASPFRVWLDDWLLGQQMAGQQTSWTLHAEDHDYELDLELHPLSAPVLNGEAGLSRKSEVAGAASYYYSIPRVAVCGHLVRSGQRLDVQGLAWLDREWGSGALAPDQEGWDWFALQLGDGSTLMFYALRKLGGRRDPNSAGTWVAADGSAHRLVNDDVRIDVLDHWSSPRGGRYASRWRVRAPALGLDLDVRPQLPDQELNTNPRYWEGAVSVSGRHAGGTVAGRGYVELVGDAHERKE